MGRTFRKEKTWDDGNNRAAKNTSKKVNTRGMRVLNSIVEDDEVDYDDLDEFEYETSDTNTTKNHTVKHTT
jgi:hypothetical protein